jgi:hypothetical protein
MLKWYNFSDEINEYRTSRKITDPEHIKDYFIRSKISLYTLFFSVMCERNSVC